MTSNLKDVVLEASNVVKRFGGLAAVDGMSLNLRAGEISALIGPNGAGKSTMMQILTGEHTPDEGTIRVLGNDVTGWAPYRVSRLGFGRTYQTGRLFWSMSVMENMLVSQYPQTGDTLKGAFFNRSAARKEEAQRVEQARKVLTEVGIDRMSNELAGSLSGGQRRLVELGRLLMTGAKLAVLDEPTAGLSPEMIDVLEGVLRLLAQKGLGILLVEHNMGLVGRVADHVRVMAFGKLIAEGSYDEIRAHEGVREVYLGV